MLANALSSLLVLQIIPLADNAEIVKYCAMAQYLTISALSASGIIWSTNKELKALASTVNGECKSAVYLYGLPSKDETILQFYLDHSYVLPSLGGLSAEHAQQTSHLKTAKHKNDPSKIVGLFRLY